MNKSATLPKPARKDPIATFLLNLFVPGLGHFHIGRYGFGFFLFLLFLALFIPLVQGLTGNGPAMPISTLEQALGFLAICSAIGGAVAANGVNAANQAAVKVALVACPFCAELIQPAAIVCRYCQRDLQAAS